MMTEEDMFFSIRPADDPILLYGENDFARQTYQHLQEKGYNVRGYIDQKYAGCWKKHGIVRTDLTGLKNLQGGGYIVIVCLQNGMLHEEVSESLYQKGINKIIYLPMAITDSLYRQDMYRRVYQYIKGFQYECIDRVPIYRTVRNMPFLIIDEWADRISFWCPIQYLHSADASMVMHNIPKHLQSAKPKLMDYADAPIQRNRPYIELFRWLNGERADIDFYLASMGRTTVEEKKALLEDRKKIYQVYEEAFHYNMGFFTASPAWGVWNSKNCFNIEDGKHRVHYLYSKGYQEMPLAVSRKDYEEFVKAITKEEISIGSKG